MLNLHNVASGVISAANPMTEVIVKKCTGVISNPDYSRTPTYFEYPEKVQFQALSQKQLEHMNDMNIQGILKKVFLKGLWEGVDRKKQKGGDLIVEQKSGNVWLIVEVLEAFHGWSSVCVSKQVD